MDRDTRIKIQLFEYFNSICFNFIIIIKDQKGMLSTMTIFFIWLGGILPEPYQQKFRTCIYEYQNCIIIGEEQYSVLTKKYNFAHHINNTIVQRADLLRLLYLQQHGGIYMDFDIEVRDWIFLKQLNCQDTFFGQELWQLLYLKLFKPSNYFICSPKNTTELDRLIKGITPIRANPNNGQILNYASPFYLVKQKAKFMIFYPSIKHCYNSNWKKEEQNFGCDTPSWIDGRYRRRREKGC